MYLLEAGLATWRLARMLVQEDGPLDVFTRLRLRSGIEYDANGRPYIWPTWNPLHCVYCTSIYTAAFILLAPRWLRTLLAASGVAAAIEEWRGTHE